MFGIVEADTEFEWADEYYSFTEGSAERWRIERWAAEHERRFKTPPLSDGDKAPVLKRLGLDFTDGSGNPLRCTRGLARQAEAAAKGLMGTMPRAEVADLADWEAKLGAEVRAHMARKRGRP